MKKKLLLLLAVASLITTFVASPITLAATCGQTTTSFNLRCKSGSSENTVTSLILTFVNFMAIGVGIAVVGGIVFGALRYITSNGNAAHTQQGITFIINSIIGLVLFIFMYALINFLVPGGLFT